MATTNPMEKLPTYGNVPRNKRVEEMSPEERLKSLQEFAEEKKYVHPGEAGTLPSGAVALALGGIGGPWGSRSASAGGYDGHLAPPSYGSGQGEAKQAGDSRKKSPVTRWLEKRRLSKAGEGFKQDGKGSENDGVLR